MIAHYLITRFNIHEESWLTKDLSGKIVCNDEWMEHRFKLFEKYCLPSILDQTSTSFDWVLLFHHKTNEKWKQYAEELVAKHPRFRILYVGRRWLVELQCFLVDDCTTDYLITTRLDNDDVLAPDYIKHVQARAVKNIFTFIDHPIGYRLKKGKLYYHLESYNPFLSLIEKNDAPQSVLSLPHGKIIARYNVITGSKDPLWMQIIHDRNYSNFKTIGAPVSVQGWVKKYVD